MGDIRLVDFKKKDDKLTDSIREFLSTELHDLESTTSKIAIMSINKGGEVRLTTYGFDDKMEMVGLFQYASHCVFQDY
jgi:hypothetical protein